MQMQRGDRRAKGEREDGGDQEQEQSQVLDAFKGLTTAGLDPCLNVSLETRAWIVQKLGTGTGRERQIGREETPPAASSGR